MLEWLVRSILGDGAPSRGSLGFGQLPLPDPPPRGSHSAWPTYRGFLLSIQAPVSLRNVTLLNVPHHVKYIL